MQVAVVPIRWCAYVGGCQCVYHLGGCLAEQPPAGLKRRSAGSGNMLLAWARTSKDSRLHVDPASRSQPPTAKQNNAGNHLERQKCKQTLGSSIHCCALHFTRKHASLCAAAGALPRNKGTTDCHKNDSMCSLAARTGWTAACTMCLWDGNSTAAAQKQHSSSTAQPQHSSSTAQRTNKGRAALNQARSC